MNIADVKKELSGDEKVLESVFKLETTYKKYKLLIWAVLLGLILFFVARTVMQTMQESKLAAANEAFLSLQENAKDTQALASLKEKNPALYELFSFAEANKAKDTKALKALVNSKNSVISDASTYALAGLEKKEVDSKLYNEMALMDDAYLLIKNGKVKEARAKLALIPTDSSLSMLAKLLKHSTLTSK